jgi:hypothetical protein
MIYYGNECEEQQEDFIVWAESHAERLEITVDYFFEEFLCQNSEYGDGK